MNFKRDILLIDLEFSGFDIKKHEILQLAAVLLDKKTLREKKVFSSYIKPTKWKHRDPESMNVNKITFDIAKGAPPLQQVIKRFDKVFGHNVILAAYVGFNDKRFLLEAYKKAKIKYRFDYHFFDLWGLFYAYLAKKNQLKGEAQDKIYQPGRGNPVNLSQDADLLLFIQQIRDEAHRFAITYHKKLRSRNLIS